MTGKVVITVKSGDLSPEAVERIKRFADDELSRGAYSPIAIQEDVPEIPRTGFWKGTHKSSFILGVMAAGQFLWAARFAVSVAEAW